MTGRGDGRASGPARPPAAAARVGQRHTCGRPRACRGQRQVQGTRAYSSSVARMPLGEDVLVERPEVCRVAGDRRGAVTPQGLLAGGEGGVGDLDRDLPSRLGGEVAAASVADLVLTVPVLARGDGADAGVGAVPVDRQQQPLGSRCSGRLPWPATEVTDRRQPVRRTASLSMSISGTVPHLAWTACLSRRRFRGSCTASSGVSLIVPLARSLICSQSQLGSAWWRASSSVRICSPSSSMNAVGSRGLRSAW